MEIFYLSSNVYERITFPLWCPGMVHSKVILPLVRKGSPIICKKEKKKEWKGTLQLTTVSPPIRLAFAVFSYTFFRETSKVPCEQRSLKRSISTNRHSAVTHSSASKRKERP